MLCIIFQDFLEIQSDFSVYRLTKRGEAVQGGFLEDVQLFL